MTTDRRRLVKYLKKNEIYKEEDPLYYTNKFLKNYNKKRFYTELIAKYSVYGDINTDKNILVALQ